MTWQELTAALNTGKEVLLGRLEADGVIVSAEAVGQQYALIAVEKGLFGKLLDKVFGLQEGKTYIRAVKL